MARALLGNSLERLEEEITYLSSSPAAPDAEVRSFTAVYEVDARARPPELRAGYELELVVPNSRETLQIELVNGQTGVINIVKVAPEGAL